MANAKCFGKLLQRGTQQIPGKTKANCSSSSNYKAYPFTNQADTKRSLEELIPVLGTGQP